MIALTNGIHRHLVCAALAALALGLLGSACKREEATRGPSTVNGMTSGPGSTVAINRAQDEITQARCDMEERCKNIGQDKTYADRNQCMTKVRDTWKEDMNFNNCSGGVDANELDKCLSEIRNHECGSVIDHLSRVMQCRTGELCRT